MDCDSEAVGHSEAMAQLVECVPNFSEGQKKEVEPSRSFPRLPDGQVPPGPPVGQIFSTLFKTKHRNFKRFLTDV